MMALAVTVCIAALVWKFFDPGDRWPMTPELVA